MNFGEVIILGLINLVSFFTAISLRKRKCCSVYANGSMVISKWFKIIAPVGCLALIALLFFWILIRLILHWEFKDFITVYWFYMIVFVSLDSFFIATNSRNKKDIHPITNHSLYVFLSKVYQRVNKGYLYFRIAYFMSWILIVLFYYAYFFGLPFFTIDGIGYKKDRGFGQYGYYDMDTYLRVEQTPIFKGKLIYAYSPPDRIMMIYERKLLFFKKRLTVFHTDIFAFDGKTEQLTNDTLLIENGVRFLYIINNKNERMYINMEINSMGDTTKVIQKF